MRLSQLGEFGLIRHLTEDITLRNASSLYGIGDDCAVLSYPESRVLVTTDMLMEGVHFDLVYTPLRHLGYKAAMVNISDVIAMNAAPRQLLVSLAISAKFSVEDIAELYAGLRLACDKHGVDVVGGDTTTSLTGLAISITCIGEAKDEDIVKRSGARESDLICVSGDLGAAYMGMRLMEREKTVYLSQLAAAKTEEARAAIDFQPDFAGREYLLERFLKPEARADITAALRLRGIRPTAMMDISDGLSSELLHICKQSHCGCRLYEERIPIDYQTAAQAETFNLNLSTCALNGGEDYELLFTVPLTDKDKIEAMDDVRMVGYITKPELGAILITRDGQEFELKAQGWNPIAATDHADPA